jgi:hypothetical protein
MQTHVDQRAEAYEVISWRCEQLVHAGFAPPMAASLALDVRYDLHGLIELVDRGCSPVLAVRILAPLEEADA